MQLDSAVLLLCRCSGQSDDLVWYSEDHPRTCMWLTTMVIVCVPKTWGCGTPSKWPFTPWLINGGYRPLTKKWDDPPSTVAWLKSRPNTSRMDTHNEAIFERKYIFQGIIWNGIRSSDFHGVVAAGWGWCDLFGQIIPTSHEQKPQRVAEVSGNPLVSIKSRLVKYYNNLARVYLFFGGYKILRGELDWKCHLNSYQLGYVSWTTPQNPGFQVITRILHETFLRATGNPLCKINLHLLELGWEWSESQRLTTHREAPRAFKMVQRNIEMGSRVLKNGVFMDWFYDHFLRCLKF